VAALLLDSLVRLALVQIKVALQDFGGAVEDVVKFELGGEPGIFRVQPSPLDLSAHQEPDRGDELHLSLGIIVALLMLHIDHPNELTAADHRHRKKRFKAIFGQHLETFETSVAVRLTGDRNGLQLLCHPPRQTLA